MAGNVVRVTSNGNQVVDQLADLLIPFYGASRVNATKPGALRLWNQELYDRSNRFVAPALDRILPVRTGKLKRSFKWVQARDQDGNLVGLFVSVLYGRYPVIRHRGRENTLKHAVVDAYNDRLDIVVHGLGQLVLNDMNGRLRGT